MPRPRGGRRPGAGRKRLSGGELRHSRTLSITNREYEALKLYLAELRQPQVTVRFEDDEELHLSERDTLCALPSIIESHRTSLIYKYKSNFGIF